MIDNSREQKPRFVIWAPSYDENSGGNIALHALCARLNELGYQAKIWPAFDNVERGVASKITSKVTKIFNSIILLLKRQYYKSGPFPRQIAKYKDLHNSIVIYPEIVFGNPLGSANVVRWLLYHPGFHANGIDFGSDEFIAAYLPEFAKGMGLGRNAVDLYVTHHNSSYRMYNIGERSGYCHLIHKGKSRQLIHHPAVSINVDNISHIDRARIFNAAKALYSYDAYSFYNTYAAICGCVPIIVPVEGVSIDEWYSDPKRRYGLAYGVENIDWAVETRSLLLEELGQMRDRENEIIQAFVLSCEEYFYSRHQE